LNQSAATNVAAGVIEFSSARIAIKMHTARSALAIAAILTLATSCGAHQRLAHGQRGEPYRLYTHCGIQWAQINGRWWRAQHRLSDGNGNPPAGWGNPFQAGTLSLTTKSTARFTSTAGTVTFRRTDRSHPPLICS
jgi:hypothetical protein